MAPTAALRCRGWSAARALAAGVGVAALATAATLGGCDSTSSGAPAPLPRARSIGSLGDIPGRFAMPRAIDTDGEALWVIDKTARVQRIDPRTGECLFWFQMPDWQLGKPVGVTVAPADLVIPGVDGGEADPSRPILFIPDTHYNRVMVYRVPARQTDPPQLLARFGTYGMGPGEFVYPTSIVLATKPRPDGGRELERVYVAEYGGNDRISVFDAHFKPLFSFGGYGASASAERVQFDRPQCLRWREGSRGRELVVSDARNHRIGRFTPEGALLGWIGSPETSGHEPGQLTFPYGLWVLKDQTVLVAEFGSNRVQRLDVETGASLGVWGRPGRGPGELATPWAIAAMGDDVFVVDSGNNRVVRFEGP
jgi:hypothetical protein